MTGAVEGWEELVYMHLRRCLQPPLRDTRKSWTDLAEGNNGEVGELEEEEKRKSKGDRKTKITKTRRRRRKRMITRRHRRTRSKTTTINKRDEE